MKRISQNSRSLNKIQYLGCVIIEQIYLVPNTCSYVKPDHCRNEKLYWLVFQSMEECFFAICEYDNNSVI